MFTQSVLGRWNKSKQTCPKTKLGHVLWLYDGAEVIGFLAVQENLFEAEVLQIAVKGAYQGQGIASALFAQLPTDKEIFLEVRQSNQRAQAFYKKEKMAVIAERKAYYHDPVEDAIIMKREIDEG
ncbi:ribosomal protein S18-alanine N-acetyltransferase [Haemophilus influenzae]|uniref:ribosomal protein S18-alanine N-acetyltransferase n=1 Tax=Haemophilus influenzae TaxID=727 RepID=UPI0022B7EE52|nr:ribosomal protein S18-alanine N-acetyltransferase [Haemophilus influenzae]